MRVHSSTFALCMLLAAAACGDNNKGGGTRDGAVADGPATADGPAADAGPTASVERGKYLVDHVAACGDCHTPLIDDPQNPDPNGPPIRGAYLSGFECFVDLNGPAAPGGCLHSKNLTNDPSGLMNRTDDQIKEMMLNGERPDDTYLVPLMPYWIFHNMTEVDADSIVMYLRTVTGVAHTVPPSDAPFTPPDEAAAPLDLSTVPMPTTVNASTMNGRYLAAHLDACLGCHTPLTNQLDFRSVDPTKFFAGNRAFPAAPLHIPSPPFPAIIYTANLTPHDPTGLYMYTAEDIVKELKMGIAKDGTGICPPMPAGPMNALGGLTDSDAADIAAFIKALPPVENMRMMDCRPTAPPP